MNLRALAPLALTLLMACGKKQTGAYEVAAATGDAAAATNLRAEADALWGERAEQAKLEAALAKYEQVYAANPTDRDVAIRLARGWYFLGDAYLEGDARLAAWDTSVSWGKKCVAINRDFTAMLEKGDETEQTAIKVLGKADAPCLYWTSTALGKWAKMQGLSTTLKHLGTVEAYMTRVTELDPSYFFWGPDRYWGAYWSLIPTFKGRDLNKSKAHFAKSQEGAAHYLATQVLIAEAYAVTAQDKALFKQTLEKVVAADVGSDPDCIAENIAAKKTAEKLLAQADEFFAE
jgi:hypothetical protein